MAKEALPGPDRPRKRLDIQTPLLGFYDAPDPALFAPLVEPRERDCLFSFFPQWLEGKTLHLTRERYGCGGTGHWMWGLETRSRKEFIKFLVEDEGLKAEAWPLLKTVTFLVNPDQLSGLCIGAQYHSAPEYPPPVIAPFGSGCSQLQPFKNPEAAQWTKGAFSTNLFCKD